MTTVQYRLFDHHHHIQPSFYLICRKHHLIYLKRFRLHEKLVDSPRYLIQSDFSFFPGFREIRVSIYKLKNNLIYNIKKIFNKMKLNNSSQSPILA